METGVGRRGAAIGKALDAIALVSSGRWWHDVAMDDLAKRIADLVLAGQKIEAIKLLREATGMGLAEARDAVEAAARGTPLPPHAPAARQQSPAPGRTGELPADVHAAASAGDRINAIKLLRKHTGLGLKEAKDELDRLLPPPAGSKRGCLLPLLFGGLLGLGALAVRGG